MTRKYDKEQLLMDMRTKLGEVEELLKTLGKARIVGEDWCEELDKLIDFQLGHRKGLEFALLLISELEE